MKISAPRTVLLAMAATCTMLILLTATTATAQPTLCPPSPCACGNATISIDASLTCGIVLCDVTAPGCITYLPGDYVVSCAQLNRFRLRDCRGVYHCLPTLGSCLRCVCARTGCCVDICMESSVAECLILRVRPSVCLGC